ncbi:MAG: N-acetylmuramoyl-L-alanine amidase [Muribaculum sp.]|nr:N-acetylmuramoyl-L-alanine amidase [Muribaculum sp.]
MQTIKKGSRGEDVKTLQKALNLMVDGIFGVLTEEAVKEFQEANRLTVDGIVGAKTWAALGIKITNSRNIKEIIVHCSATPEEEDYTVDQIRDWHVNGNGWSDIGYHYVIYRDGSVHTGRPESIAGAHCTNHNTISVGVCYIGGCPPRSVKDWNHKSKDTRTGQQKLALVKLLRELKKRYPNAKIYPHSKFANKPCPGFDAEKEYRNLK